MAVSFQDKQKTKKTGLRFIICLFDSIHKRFVSGDDIFEASKA